MSHSNPVADRQLALLANIDLLELHKKGIVAAKAAAQAENDRLGPEQSRGFDCGFAWIHAPDVRLNTKVGKQLLALGYTKYHPTGVMLWYGNLHDIPTQSIGVHIAAVQAYAEVIKANDQGIRFITGSRYD